VRRGLVVACHGKQRRRKRIEDVLAIGRALRAWPLPLLHDVQDDDAQRGIRLSTCWQALGLPAEAAGWSNATTLEFFHVRLVIGYAMLIRLACMYVYIYVERE
jgi:hypothetical protein